LEDIEEFMKVAVTAFEPKACWEWLLWGRVHLFTKLVNEVSTEQVVAALAKHIEVEERAKQEEEEAWAVNLVTMQADLEERWAELMGMIHTKSLN
jgi:hypothetical protein